VARGGAFNVFRAVESLLQIQKQAVASGVVDWRDEERVSEVATENEIPSEIEFEKASTPIAVVETESKASDVIVERTQGSSVDEKNVEGSDKPVVKVTEVDATTAVSSSSSSQVASLRASGQQFKMASLGHLADPNPAKYPVVSVKQMHAGTRIGLGIVAVMFVFSFF
jgi:hypothetical protein